MSVLTVRLPDAKHARIKELALSSGVSTNKLIEELATVALATDMLQFVRELRSLATGLSKALPLLDERLRLAYYAMHEYRGIQCQLVMLY